MRGTHGFLRRKGILIGVLLIAAAAAVFVVPAFGDLTVSNSAESVEAFLEDWNGQDVTVVKTARVGRIKAVLYENETGQLGVNVFERRLFGLRWKHDGMNLYDEDGTLYMCGRWTEGGLRGSRCDVVVCGDNRGGEVLSYAIPDAGIEDTYVPVQYVLDIYILDGIEALPQTLQQERAG